MSLQAEGMTNVGEYEFGADTSEEEKNTLLFAIQTSNKHQRSDITR